MEVAYSLNLILSLLRLYSLTQAGQDLEDAIKKVSTTLMKINSL